MYFVGLFTVVGGDFIPGIIVDSNSVGASRNGISFRADSIVPPDNRINGWPVRSNFSR